MQDREMLTDVCAAELLGVSASFLRKARCSGVLGDATPPPPHVKIGRAVRYRRRDLMAWLDARTVSPGRRRGR
jgi:hypothetical protein